MFGCVNGEIGINIVFSISARARTHTHTHTHTHTEREREKSTAAHTEEMAALDTHAQTTCSFGLSATNPAVHFSQNKPTTSNQPAVLFS
jgi:hypothetical protein